MFLQYISDTDFFSRLAKELGVPVFLYGAASERDYRKTMPQVLFH